MALIKTNQNKNMPEQTPEQMKAAEQAAAAELDGRVKGFNAELIPLLGKYKIGLGAVPVLTPDGRIVAKPSIFDDSKPKEDAPAEGEVTAPAAEKKSELSEA